MYERVNDTTRALVVQAQEEARTLGQAEVAPAHAAIAMTHPLLSECEAARAWRVVGIDHARLQRAVRRISERQEGERPHLPFDQDLKDALARALAISIDDASPHLQTGHLLRALLDGPGAVLDRALTDLAVDRETLRAAAIEMTRDHPERGTVVGVAVPAPRIPVAPATGRGTIGFSTSMYLPNRSPFGRLPALSVAGCSLCGQLAPRTGRLVSGTAGGSICEGCVASAAQLLEAPRADNPPDESPRLWMLDPNQPRAIPGMSETEARAATEAIRAVLADLARVSDDGRDAVSVVDGQGLGPSLREARERFPGDAPFAFLMDAIEFLTPDTASVSFSVSSPMNMVIPAAGLVVRTDDGWKVARETLTSLLAMAGVHVPPPPS